MAEKDSKESSEQAVAEPKGGAVKGIMKWLTIGIAFFAISIVSPVVSQKIFGAPDASHEGEAEAEEKEEPKGPPLYFAIEPSLVASLSDGGVMRFVQIDIQLMSHDPEVIPVVEAHDPRIRNDLLMLLSAQELATLKTREGKDALRKEALAEVQKVLKEVTKKKGVEDLFFTGFVIQ